MTAHVIGLALVVAGTAVVALAAVGSVAVRGDVFTRLHFVTPVTSLGGPLVCAGLCVESRQPWVIAELLVIALLLFMSGPVLEASAARAAAQDRGIESEEQPA
ncbi:MAG TPA: monovalent cation/H(+) antiporter subunit G [Mycobacteriales bacterium]|nr:monovalent cation/H(+) antiporter subunit G [Mycobacteriales bacterium]